MIHKIKILATIFIFGFIAYILLYQNIINERVKLEDEHCIRVNPHIIKRKNLYIDSMRALLVDDDKYLYDSVNAQYIAESDKYINEEGKWLSSDLKMLSNPLVKMVVIKRGYEGALMLHRIYELDFINTKIIVSLLNKKDEDKQNKLSKSLPQNVNESNKLNEDYDRIVASKQKDYRWVDYLIKTPQTTCPVENYNIPDVESELKKMF